MRAIFLADAHLRNPDDANYRALLEFLDAQKGRIDLLALLGDICEFMVGLPDGVFPPYRPLFDLLADLQRNGTQLVYVEGNHDFHLARYFDRNLPCRVFPDHGAIDLDGRRVLLEHGDLANPHDRGYRLLRGFWRSSALRLLIKLLPPGATWAIGQNACSVSRQRRPRRSDDPRPARDILLPYARHRLAEGYDVMVTGHFHQPFREKIGSGELLALGDWIEQFSYAVWEDGAFRLERFTPRG